MPDRRSSALPDRHLFRIEGEDGAQATVSIEHELMGDAVRRLGARRVADLVREALSLHASEESSVSRDDFVDARLRRALSRPTA